MGQVNCHCQLPSIHQSLVLQEKTINLNNKCQQPSSKRHRVKSIVSPRVGNKRTSSLQQGQNYFRCGLQDKINSKRLERQVSVSTPIKESNKKKSNRLSDNPTLSVSFMLKKMATSQQNQKNSIRISLDNTLKIIKNVLCQERRNNEHKNIVNKYETINQAELTMLADQIQEQFIIQAKYNQSKDQILIRDGGGQGLGIFKVEHQQISIDMQQNGGQIMLQSSVGRFVILNMSDPHNILSLNAYMQQYQSADRKQISCTVLSIEDKVHQPPAFNKISRSLPSIFPTCSHGNKQIKTNIKYGQRIWIDENMSIVNDWPIIRVKPHQRHFYHYLQQFRSIKQGDMLRCGPFYYKVQGIERYCCSSRVIQRY